MNKTYEQKLIEWNQLRSSVLAEISVESALQTINSWWFDQPWTPYHLHWDDFKSWPDPWELLFIDRYCDVSRGLAMMYTIVLIDRHDMQNFDLIYSVDNSTTLIHTDGYVLNMDKEFIVNTPPKSDIANRLSQDYFKEKLL